MPWNEHPKLRGRFHPEFPEDLQVIVHDASPAKSGGYAELVWVRVTGCDDEIFSGIVLNKPSHLRDVTEFSSISFIVPDGGQYPLQVTPKYLSERSMWRILMPCKGCGLTELLYPPTELVAYSFPLVTAAELSKGFTFTTRCGWCGGGMVVRLKRTA